MRCYLTIGSDTVTWGSFQVLSASLYDMFVNHIQEDNLFQELKDSPTTGAVLPLPLGLQCAFLVILHLQKTQFFLR